MNEEEKKEAKRNNRMTIVLQERLLRHLTFAQDIITRMGANSFKIKQMAIAIVVVALIVATQTWNVLIPFICILPMTVLWFLDAYYLQQERKFRGVYKAIARRDLHSKDFAMRPDLFTGGQYTFTSALFSKTIVWLYIPLIITLIAFGLV